MWHTGTEYRLDVDSAAFTDIYGKASLTAKKPIVVKTDDDFANLTVRLENVGDATYVGELLDTSDKPLRTTFSDNGILQFKYIKPGDYYLRVFYDDNGITILTDEDDIKALIEEAVNNLENAEEIVEF